MDSSALAEKGPSMGRKRPHSYPADFRLKIVELARSGRGIDELAREFMLAPQTVPQLVKIADIDSGRRSDGLTTSERDELAKLRKENSQLKG